MDKALQQKIIDTVYHTLAHGSGNVMRQGEVDRGYTPIYVGDYPWLLRAEWYHDCVLSLDGNRVRIIAVHALVPGHGAFSRLITGILRAGLHPVVIAPFDEMQEILEGWGWHRRILGTAFEDRYDEWWPTRKWKEQRTKG